MTRRHRWPPHATALLLAAGRTLAAFSARLNDATDLGAVRDDLLAVVRQSLEPAHASVWIARGGR